MGVLSWLASEAPLVLMAWMWNAMVPRLEMVTTLKKTGYQCDACNFAEAVGSKSIEGVRRWIDFDSANGYDGFDGVVGGFDGAGGGFDVACSLSEQFARFASFVMIVYIVTVILTAELWCL